MRKIVFMALAVLAVAAFTAPVATGAKPRVHRATVSLTVTPSVPGHDSQTTFEIRVVAGGGCQGNRLVTVTGSRSDVGGGRTNSRGNYKFTKIEDPADGPFFAILQRRVFKRQGITHVCQGGRSRMVSLPHD